LIVGGSGEQIRHSSANSGAHVYRPPGIRWKPIAGPESRNRKASSARRRSARSDPDANCLVEAEEGIAVIPSFGLPACRNRKIATSQLINPIVRFDLNMISRRGRELPPGADEFTLFLKSYIATWAGRAGVL
jgi:DNA-binding transcriptional LysR family regulator